MKKRAPIILSLLVLISIFVISCDDGTIIPPDLFGITIEDVTYIDDSTYDFELVEAESGSKTATLILTNSGNAEISVTAVEISDAVNYTLTIPALPYTAAPDDSTEVSVTFNPAASGAMPATISITIAGFSEAFVLNLDGEGNYSPEVRFGISVTGAGNTAYNGFYERNGFLSPLADYSPRYDKSGSTEYYSYIYDGSDNYFWCIADSLNADYSTDTYPEYDNEFWGGIPMVPTEGLWTPFLGTGPDSQPTISLNDITGVAGVDNEELTANYYYSDADGDAEDTAATAYQWFSSDAVDGTYTAISGATNKTLIPNESAIFLKVEVTPAASTGITAGATVRSSATREIIPSGPPMEQ